MNKKALAMQVGLTAVGVILAFYLKDKGYLKFLGY